MVTATVKQSSIFYGYGHCNRKTKLNLLRLWPLQP